jgi:hypothetical protein
MTETRSEIIKFRATTEEKERIEVLAEEFGQKTSDYVRTCSLVGPTPTRTEEVPYSHVEEPPGDLTTEDMQALLVPEDATRDDYVRYLYERITELHRDTQRRWPGVTGRHQAGEEWKLVREGKPLEKIPQRGNYAPVPPTTYRTTDG